MANSNDVVAGDDILASQYNNLRADVMNTSTGHTHSGTDSKSLASNSVVEATITNGSVTVNKLGANCIVKGKVLTIVGSGYGQGTVNSSTSIQNTGTKDRLYVFSLDGSSSYINFLATIDGNIVARASANSTVWYSVASFLLPVGATVVITISKGGAEYAGFYYYEYGE